MVLVNTSIVSATPGPYRIERPKVIHNAFTGQFVLWFHLDTVPFSMASVGVGTAATCVLHCSACADACRPLGPFAFVAGFQPDGQPSYDVRAPAAVLRH